MYLSPEPNDPNYPNSPAPSPQAPPTTRYNTTPDWQDPYHPPSPGDPYWADWIAANPDYTGARGNTWPGGPLGPGTTPLPNGGTSSPGTVGFGSNGTGITSPFTGIFAPPTPNSIGTFNAPQFTGPTPQDALNDPGYQFVTQQGEQGLQNWAAAKGTLNDSGTAKALIDYGQGAAGQQYNNVWNRNFNAWKTGVLDPATLSYATNAQNTSHLNDVANTNSWNDFLQKWNIFRDQRDSTFDKNVTLATA